MSTPTQSTLCQSVCSTRAVVPTPTLVLLEAQKIRLLMLSPLYNMDYSAFLSEFL
jgi:hypothetical protein